MSMPEFPAEQPRYPEASQATTALVLGILGVFFTIFAPVAWWMSQRELVAIDSGQRPPENRSTAKVAKVLGIIGTVLLGLGLLLAVVVFTLILPVSFR
ncbi:MAG: DUF4190 domain-containing protein [Acidimicrobiia bacterium]